MKIDGKKIAQDILESLKKKVEKLKKGGITPKLAIILVGNDPASIAYVKRKEIKAKEIGIITSIYKYPSSVSEKDLLKQLNDLNHLINIHGIIVQQPLPPHTNIEKITQAIDPKKDIDGFHPQSKFEHPIAAAVLEILKKTPLKSKKIIIVGKGETGGKLIIQAIKKAGIEPAVIDSKTEDPETLTKNADIIISAVGKPNIIKPSMVKKGVVLIGIGLHKGSDGKLHGDYDEEKIKDKASFYTPTPGGVGPINVAMLLKNLLTACENFSR